MNAKRCGFPLAAALLVCGGVGDAADSGPEAGTATEAFEVSAVLGEVQNETVDFVKRRDGKPTVWYFVPHEKWSRPSARLLRRLDERVGDVAADSRIVAIWLTDDDESARNYLQRAQNSLKFARTDFAVYKENATGPGTWGLNTEVDTTVVVTRGGKVIKSFAVVSPNETVADEILSVLRSE